MFPLRDNIPSRTTPVVNYSMIGICAVVFFLQLQEEGSRSILVEKFGMIPARITHPGQEILIPVERRGDQILVAEAADAAVPPLMTLLTCIFLHGGWMHFIGNMWFLYVFGDNVEDRLGHVGYLIFYLLAGSLASLSHLVTDPSSMIPTIGASGAIAGVMGAYMVFYPHARVLGIVPIFILFWFVELPAPIFLGIWFVIQFVSGFASITNDATTGVAWWAHIGGFVLGAVVAYLMATTRMAKPAVESRRSYERRMVVPMRRRS